MLWRVKRCWLEKWMLLRRRRAFLVWYIKTFVSNSLALCKLCFKLSYVNALTTWSTLWCSYIILAMFTTVLATSFRQNLGMFVFSLTFRSFVYGFELLYSDLRTIKRLWFHWVIGTSMLSIWICFFLKSLNRFSNDILRLIKRLVLYKAISKRGKAHLIVVWLVIDALWYFWEAAH